MGIRKCDSCGGIQFSSTIHYTMIDNSLTPLDMDGIICSECDKTFYEDDFNIGIGVWVKHKENGSLDIIKDVAKDGGEYYPQGSFLLLFPDKDGEGSGWYSPDAFVRATPTEIKEFLKNKE